MSTEGEKIVLDLETKKSFEEAGGKNYELLGISVAGIYSYEQDKFKIFLEDQLAGLVPYLQQAKLVIGFNTKRFDYRVLQPYLDLDLGQLPSLDILEEVEKSLGFRVSLNNIARGTLGFGKIGTGLDALKYFRNGQMDKLAQYCQHDVFVTREVYEYGCKYGQLLYLHGAYLETILIGWSESLSIDQILREACSRNLSVEIEYASATKGTAGRLNREIDIYDFNFGRIVAYCHLRKELRHFNIRRVLSAKLTNKEYQLPPNFSHRDKKEI